MSTCKIPHHATVEDGDSDTSETVRAAPRAAKANPRTSDAWPPIPIVIPDFASDSGYSSRTAATVDSAASTRSQEKKPDTLHIKTDASPTKVQTVGPNESQKESLGTVQDHRRKSRSRSKTRDPHREENRGCTDPHCVGQCKMRRIPPQSPLESPWNVNYAPFNQLSTCAPVSPYPPPSPQTAIPFQPYPQNVSIVGYPHPPQYSLTMRPRPVSYYSDIRPDPYPGAGGLRHSLERSTPYSTSANYPYPSVAPHPYPMPGSFPPNGSSYPQAAPRQPQISPTFPSNEYSRALPHPHSPEIARPSVYRPVISYDHAHQYPDPGIRRLTGRSSFDDCEYCNRDRTRMPPPPRPAKVFPIRRSASHRQASGSSRRAVVGDHYKYDSSSDYELSDRDATSRLHGRSASRPTIPPTKSTSYSTARDKKIVETSKGRHYSYLSQNSARTNADKSSAAEQYQDNVSGRSTTANVGSSRRSRLTEEALDRAAAAGTKESRSSESGHPSWPSVSRSRAGSSREGSHVSKSGASAVEPFKIRLDASKGYNLEFSGNMDGRSMSMQPGENGMAEVIIGSSRREIRYEQGGSMRSSKSGAGPGGGGRTSRRSSMGMRRSVTLDEG